MADLKQVSLGLVAGMAVGAVTLGTVGVNAVSDSGESRKGSKAAHGVASEVLGLEKAEIREMKQAGQTFEEIVLANGFSSIDDFKVAVEVELRATLAEKGLSQEEIDAKIEQRQLRSEIRDDFAAVSQELLGVSKDELRQQDQDRETVLSNAGFADKEEFREAVLAGLETMWADEGLSDESIDSRLEAMKKGKKHGRR